MFKNIKCNSLSASNVDSSVLLAGWVHRRRDHGQLIFIDLRDDSGLVQIVVDPDKSPESYKLASDIRNEWVIQISGIVKIRPEGTRNTQLQTGDIEIETTELKILNEATTPPFPVNDNSEIDDYLKLRFRPIYLRRQKMASNLKLRHKIVKFIRDFLSAKEFLEIETPLLIKSTPEGARDYLVPSRVYPGSFFALPQSPQQLKQILMVAGIEKYFQIARCFRDEDLRADRQPEFTQLDLEMSFVEQEDILNLTEELITELVNSIDPSKKLITPFPRFTYEDAMEKYGTDKPDLRYGIELINVTEILENVEFDIITKTIKDNGVIKGIVAPKCGTYTRRQLDNLQDIARTQGAVAGVMTIVLGSDECELEKLKPEDIKSPLSKHLSFEIIKKLAKEMNAKGGDLILLIADNNEKTNNALGILRQHIASANNLADGNLLAMAFITDFPLLDWDETNKRWTSSHHPFTAPKYQDLELLDSNPGKVMSEAYDLVCNNYELGSGSIRIHQRKLQEKILSILGYNQDEIVDRFGHLLESLESGAPPHGGIAPGIDRIVMVLAGEDNLREVIAFPKTQNSSDPLFGSPSEIDPVQLEELGLTIKNQK
ncbi:MAG: aspartate--tRNA ligase [Chloroflexi bacterium]|nr:aspartate--tRNA ligase [Chloroflexota bacterium]